MNNALKWAATGLIAVVALVLINVLIACLMKIKVENGSDFGGIFGLSSAIFTGLAFAGLLYAISLQREEVRAAQDSLKTAREELRLSRENQEKLNDQLELQNDESHKKSIEDTFFNLVSVIGSIKREIVLLEYRDYDWGGYNRVIEQKNGNDALLTIAQEIVGEMTIAKRCGESLSNTYDKYYEFRRNAIGHYFRMIFYTLKLIDKEEKIDRKFYANVLRASLSDAEVCILAFNGIGKYGKEIKPLLEKYAMLNNLNNGQVGDLEADIRLLYADGALE